MAGITEKDQQALIWRVKAILDNTATVTGGPTAGEKNELHFALAEAGQTITGEDLAAVKDSANAGAKAGSIAGSRAALEGATVTSTGTVHVGD